MKRVPLSMPRLSHCSISRERSGASGAGMAADCHRPMEQHAGQGPGQRWHCRGTRSRAVINTLCHVPAWNSVLTIPVPLGTACRDGHTAMLTMPGWAALTHWKCPLGEPHRDCGCCCLPAHPACSGGWSQLHSTPTQRGITQATACESIRRLLCMSKAQILIATAF